MQLFEAFIFILQDQCTFFGKKLSVCTLQKSLYHLQDWTWVKYFGGATIQMSKQHSFKKKKKLPGPV